MDYLREYSSSDEETPGTPCTISRSPTPEPKGTTASDSNDDAPGPATPIHLPGAGSQAPLFPPTGQPTQHGPTLQNLRPGTKPYEAWMLLQSVGDFDDESATYNCPFCAALGRAPNPRPLCPRLLSHVARCHLEHFTCIFCEGYSSSRVDQLGRHRTGSDMTQCRVVKKLGGAKAYENLYQFLVDNDKDIWDRQLGKLVYRFAALEARSQSQETEE